MRDESGWGDCGEEGAEDGVGRVGRGGRNEGGGRGSGGEGGAGEGVEVSDTLLKTWWGRLMGMYVLGSIKEGLRAFIERRNPNWVDSKL